MAKDKPSNKHYSQKEIGAALNNAVLAAFGSPELAELEEPRKRQLRNYTAAIIDVIIDHRKKGYLRSNEELVAVLTSAALFTHVLLVAKGSIGKLAAYEDLAKRIVDDMESPELDG